MNAIDRATTPTDRTRPLGPRESVRRRVIGVDLWVECPSGREQVVSQARLAAMRTHLRLSEAWDKVGSENTARVNELAELQLRFVARRDDVHLTDEAICELLDQLAGRIRWSQLVKLEEFDGVSVLEPRLAY